MEPEPDVLRPSPGLTAVGANVLRLVATWPAWVKRRVETIDFLDEAMIRRSVRVDLDLSDHMADSLRVDWKGCILVPIAALRRAPHATFVVDEEGAKLPRLNKFEERELCFAAMFGWAEQLATRAGQELRPTFSAELRAVIYEEHTRQAARGLVAAGFPPDEDGAFRSALEDMTENFYLLVPLGRDDRQRRVLRYSYVETFQDPTRPDGRRGRLREAWRWSADRARLVDATYTIRVPAVGDCESFHLEINAPWDLTLTRAELEVTPGGKPGGKGRPPQTYAVEEWHPSQAHIFAPVGEAIVKGEATLVLQPMPTGLVRASFLGAALIAAVLTLAAVLLVLDRTDVFATDFWSSPEAVVVVLLLPVVGAVSLLKESKHRLTAKLLYNVRMGVVAAAGMAFCVALSVAFGWSEEVRLWTWPLAALGALASTARLGAQFLRSRNGLRERRESVTGAHRRHGTSERGDRNVQT